MTEYTIATSTNASQRDTSTMPSDDATQVHTPPRSSPAFTHNDKVLMLILLLQQETGVPIPGATSNQQRKDVYAVGSHNVLKIEEVSWNCITGTGTVASVPPLDLVADGDDESGVSKCYWADSESNNDVESTSLSLRL
jgi:hypothetical protein